MIILQRLLASINDINQPHVSMTFGFEDMPLWVWVARVTTVVARAWLGSVDGES